MPEEAVAVAGAIRCNLKRQTLIPIGSGVGTTQVSVPKCRVMITRGCGVCECDSTRECASLRVSPVKDLAE